MTKHNYKIVVRNSFFFVFALMLCQLHSQQDQSIDSLETPFRKGRWLTGLSGSIGANTNKVNSSTEKTITNDFGIDISTGRFIKDRWLLGGSLNLDRTNSSGSIDRTTESLFVGPFLSYYLSPSSRGSLFLSYSPGYVLYRDETAFNNLPEPSVQTSEGDGFGSLLALGYSYVIQNRIAFDIGFELNLFWIGVEERLEPQGTTLSQNISINNIAFTFGFNVILDDFFF